MDLQNEQEHEGASFEAYFRDPASAADSPLAWAVSQRSAVLDALRGLFSGPPAMVQLRVWCFMELVSVPHGRISREDLNQLFHLLLPQSRFVCWQTPTTVLPRPGDGEAVVPAWIPKHRRLPLP